MKFLELLPPHIAMEEEIIARMVAEIQADIDNEIIQDMLKLNAQFYPETNKTK
jgi:hypothetical protein